MGISRGLWSVFCLLLMCGAAFAADDVSGMAATAGEVAHKQKMRSLFPDPFKTGQPTPSSIPQTANYPDPSGLISSYLPNGTVQTKNNAFFQNLGTNDRTCFSCHQPQDGWGLSAKHAQDRFAANPNDPLFRLVDGAVCPSADVSSDAAKRAAYSLLLDKGLIRVALPMQESMQFEIINIDDPYGCNTNPLTGLTGKKSGFVSVYRRPLPTANLGFLSEIMWDGREPDLFHQAVDATLGHAQGTVALTVAQQQQIVGFEGCDIANNPAACGVIPPKAGVSTAQLVDDIAGYLNANGAVGGPTSLWSKLAGFFMGMNDPAAAGFTPVIFAEYESWSGSAIAARASIARGETLFNSVPIAAVRGTCGTCHDTPSVGNHSVKSPRNIGVSNAEPLVIDVTGLPVFTLWCTAGPLAGQTFEVTDIGRAMITGLCADIGKMKVPVLRGLAARAPYFHNGGAATLEDVVEFYNQRFGIGMTAADKTDLVAFLKAL